MDNKRRADAILIAGPTASGKSALAIALAQRLGGLVINADSMQVYRDLQIITARPNEAEERLAPHALFGMIDGAITYSVSLWLADAEAALARARRDGLVPIFAGGTGLYFKALTQGLSDIPLVPAQVRADVRHWAEGRPPQELHAELVRRDPLTAARLRPTDPQRLLRALEVHEATGQSLAGFQARRVPALLDADRIIAVALVPDRDVLRTRIDQRFDAMISEGALDEVRRLSDRNLDPALPVMRAHGVPPLLAHFRDGLDLADAIIEGKAATRRYVKRQGTFTRNQLPNFHAIEPERAEAYVLDQLV